MFKPSYALPRLAFMPMLVGCALAASLALPAMADEEKYKIQKIDDKPWKVPGEFQKPGEFQVPGDIQKAGTVDGCTVTLTAYADTLFEFDKSTLAPGAEKPLQQATDAIAAEDKLQRLRVRGHTDAKGTDAYNDKLSKERAATVHEWLAKRMPTLPPVIVEGAGERYPVKPNTNPDGSDNPEGRALNRRVEIILELCAAN